jgi:hypothetical protein
MSERRRSVHAGRCAVNLTGSRPSAGTETRRVSGTIDASAGIERTGPATRVRVIVSRCPFRAALARRDDALRLDCARPCPATGHDHRDARGAHYCRQPEGRRLVGRWQARRRLEQLVPALVPRRFVGGGRSPDRLRAGAARARERSSSRQRHMRWRERWRGPPQTSLRVRLKRAPVGPRQPRATTGDTV